MPLSNDFELLSRYMSMLFTGTSAKVIGLIKIAYIRSTPWLYFVCNQLVHSCSQGRLLGVILLCYMSSSNFLIASNLILWLVLGQFR